MDQRTKNISLVNPSTGQVVAKEVDDKGNPTEPWTVVNACLTAVGAAPAKDTAEVIRNTDLYGKVKNQLTADYLTLSQSDFSDLSRIVNTFQPFLQKGIIFVDLFQAIQKREDVQPA